MRTPEQRAAQELSERFSKIEHRGTLGESFSRLKSGIDGLSQMAATRNPFDTPEGHRVKVGKQAQKLQQQLGKILETARGEHLRQSGSLSGQAVERLNLRPNRFESEIRAVLLRMPTHADRLQWLQETAKDPSNGPIIGALLEAPAALHGIAPDALRSIEREFIQNNAPDLVQKQNDLDQALEIVTALHRTAERISASHQDHAELQRIEQDAARAEAAAAEVQKALA